MAADRADRLDRSARGGADRWRYPLDLDRRRAAASRDPGDTGRGAAATPPPPPPPKKKTSSNTQQTKPRPDPKQLVQPTETQKVEEKKEEAEDAGDDKGEEGGVEGGVAGGVVGGVVGNQPPPAPPKPTGPKQLSSVQGGKQLAVNTQVPPYRMNPPKALQGMKFVAAFMVCVNEQGGTMGLKLTRSSGNPTIDNLMKRAVGSWKYRPFVENGVAMKFCWNPVYVHDERS